MRICPSIHPSSFSGWWTLISFILFLFRPSDCHLSEQQTVVANEPTLPSVRFYKKIRGWWLLQALLLLFLPFFLPPLLVLFSLSRRRKWTKTKVGSIVSSSSSSRRRALNTQRSFDWFDCIHADDGDGGDSICELGKQTDRPPRLKTKNKKTWRFPF